VDRCSLSGRPHEGNDGLTSEGSAIADDGGIAGTASAFVTPHVGFWYGHIYAIGPVELLVGVAIPISGSAVWHATTWRAGSAMRADLGTLRTSERTSMMSATLGGG
jgi:hypothetical protein